MGRLSENLVYLDCQYDGEGTYKLQRTFKGNTYLFSDYSPEAHPLGYPFLGWSATPDGPIIAEPTIGVPSGSCPTFYAIWDKTIIRALTYDMDLLPDVTMQVSTATTVTLPARDNKKYFKGWSLQKDGPVITDPTYTPTQDVTLYAVWAEAIQGQVHVVQFDENEGSGTMFPVGCGDEFEIPECEFTPPVGMVFDYWYFKGAPDVHYQPGQKVTLTDLLYTLVASWKLGDAVRINYWRNASGTDTEKQSYSYLPGEIYLGRNPYTNDTKSFKGWSIDRSELIGTIDGYFVYTDTEHDLDLYAIWG